jgi:hypothetical protein
MRRLPTRRTLLLPLALILAPHFPLHACQCMRIGEACQAAWTSDAVFVGRVINISSFIQHEDFGAFRQNRVTLAVTETFNGPTSKSFEIVTGMGNGDCGFPFTKGQDYLVYASKEAGKWSSSICSRTQRLDHATSDLSYLRSLSSAPPPSRIFGFITTESRMIGIEMRYVEKAPHPVAGVTINLESGGLTRKTVTDTSGNYAFESLPSGKFNISAEMPNDMGGGQKRSFDLPAHACSQHNFVANETGQISGRLVDQDGHPAITTIVGVVPIGISPKPALNEAFTDAHGNFTLQHLPPGDYWLGVNVTEPPRGGKNLSCPFPPTYYPGVSQTSIATVFHVNGKHPISGLELRLPEPLPIRTIKGTVTLPDGKPSLGAFIELKDSEFPNRSVDLGIADNNSHFVVTGVAGRQYSLSAGIGNSESETRMQSETVLLTVDNNGPVILALRPQPAKHPRP